MGRREEVVVGLADQLRARAAHEVAEGLVDEHEPKRAVLHEDGVTEVLDDLPEVLARRGEDEGPLGDVRRAA